jgi:hypothetical protein
MRVRSYPGTMPVSVRRRGIHYEMPGVSRSERPGTATVAMAESDTTTHAKENAKQTNIGAGTTGKQEQTRRFFLPELFVFGDAAGSNRFF